MRDANVFLSLLIFLWRDNIDNVRAATPICISDHRKRNVFALHSRTGAVGLLLQTNS